MSGSAAPLEARSGECELSSDRQYPNAHRRPVTGGGRGIVTPPEAKIIAPLLRAGRSCRLPIGRHYGVMGSSSLLKISAIRSTFLMRGSKYSCFQHQPEIARGIPEYAMPSDRPLYERLSKSFLDFRS